MLKDSGVNTYRWQGGQQTTADIISDRIKEHATAGWHRSLPSAYVKGRKAWPISGTREQSVLNGLIRDSLRQEGCWVRKTRPLQP
ncbi:hypothetical protein C2M09_28800 (plasmid) [Klebsiella pneumoniae]|nr:hypothetical protein C2M09_28800 [Klebsiella pneumoniae]